MEDDEKVIRGLQHIEYTLMYVAPEENPTIFCGRLVES